MAATVTQTPASEKPAPNSGKPLEGLKNAPEDTNPLKGNPYFPRFGSQAAHDEFVNLLQESFHAKQVGDIALRVARAMHKFVNAMLGTGVVRKSPMEPPSPGDTPDIGERDPSSAADTVSNDAFSYENPFDKHYSLIAQQAQQGAQSVYS